MKGEYKLVLGGEFATREEKLSVLNKYNNEEITKVSLASKEDIEECFEKAHSATSQMAALTPGERAEILQHLHALIFEHADDFAEFICLEAGKPIAAAKGEVDRCLITLDEAVKEAALGSPDGTWREHASGDTRHSLLIRRFPVGVAAFITPFNFPLNLVMHKVAPAIVAGCPFVLKPTRKTPLCSLLLGELLMKTKLPKGAFSVLVTKESSAVTSNKRVKVISFTGGAEVGWKIKESAVKTNVVLELGGNAACVVDKDVADLDHIADRICAGAFGYSGQSCISVQRVLVHKDHYSTLCEKLKEKTKGYNEAQGDPHDENTKLGPLITEDDAKRIEEWVNEAVENHGGKILCGGKRNGNIYDATFVLDVDKSSKLWTHEAFGPVAVVHPFSTFQEAIDMTNDSEFGLQAGVFTRDMQKSFYAFENIVVGGVVINDIPSARVDMQPYGGVKSSGCGREGVRYALEHLTDMRVMVMNNISSYNE